MRKYPPLFERIQTNPESEGKLIREIQREYEKFWRAISRRLASNAERTLAMRDMQSSCMWLCRSIAVNGFKPDEPTKDPLGAKFGAMLEKELGCTLVDCTPKSTLNPVINPSKVAVKITHKS